MIQKIYLDNNATSPLDPSVLEAMQPFWQELFGNADSQHSFGQETIPYLEKARDQIYAYCNASNEDTICITSGATESINTVHRHFLELYLSNPSQKTQIITSSIEHPSMRESLQYLARYGIEIISLEYVEKNLFVEEFLQHYQAEKTLLVSMSFAHHETGIILPIKEILEHTQVHQTPFHTDATQYFGKMALNLHEIPVDFLSFSGHKFHAPKGIGGLFVKKNCLINPLLHGSLQMANIRSGTLNTPSIVAMGCALEIAQKDSVKNINSILSLKKILEDFLLSIPDTKIYGFEDNRLPNTTFVKIPKIDHNYITWYLNENGIAVSTGAACESLDIGQSQNSEKKNQGVRFSLSKFNTTDEIQKTISLIKKIL